MTCLHVHFYMSNTQKNKALREVGRRRTSYHSLPPPSLPASPRREARPSCHCAGGSLYLLALPGSLTATFSLLCFPSHMDLAYATACLSQGQKQHACTLPLLTPSPYSLTQGAPFPRLSSIQPAQGRKEEGFSIIKKKKNTAG